MLGGQSLAMLKSFAASIVDTAICAKPDGVLAGQLLYGDSIHRSHSALICAEAVSMQCASCNLSCQKIYHAFPLPAERV
jgi:hypothetical protein